jgi:hypothetical protein
VRESGEGRPDVDQTGERKASVRRAEGPGLGGLVETAADVGFPVGGGDLENARAAGVGPRERRNQAEDDVELEIRGDAVRRDSLRGA